MRSRISLPRQANRTQVLKSPFIVVFFLVDMLSKIVGKRLAEWIEGESFSASDRATSIRNARADDLVKQDQIFRKELCKVRLLQSVWSASPMRVRHSHSKAQSFTALHRSYLAWFNFYRLSPTASMRMEFGDGQVVRVYEQTIHAHV